ncbi:hypothetical protein ELUMI_v1c05190 [Williamsoniiplasma luminosum]|uniref:Uncharacterized protein n=2 Tax=Williamsoniiplasma luminosum TaxID=214888 RepID=A0A2K8NX82_9MOLU|nr:hypothetical protein [Williamsoniiplasma luminosum]ATZ17243.1 hypothetical protein ELUMI_v1c05190 [Williamsoniiplasma luminosum]
MKVGQLLKLYRSSLYAVKYINYKNGKDIMPFDFENVNDMLKVKGFKVYFDSINMVDTIVIGICEKQYISLKNDPEIGGNITNVDYLENQRKWN